MTEEVFTPSARSSLPKIRNTKIQSLNRTPIVPPIPIMG